MACSSSSSSSSSLWSTDNRATFKGFCEYPILDMFGWGPKANVLPQMQALLTSPRVLDTVVLGKAF
jgi:hypothetical protein